MHKSARLSLRPIAQAAGLLSLLCVSGAAMAQSSVTLGGVMDSGLRIVKNSGLPIERTEMSGSNMTSRFYMRGTEDLGGGLSAGFHVETGLQLPTGSTASSVAGQFWDRRSTVSFTSKDFGEVRAGRDHGRLLHPVERVHHEDGIARFGEPLAHLPERRALAHECVRHVGEAVAVVVADSWQQARDAAEAVQVDRLGVGAGVAGDHVQLRHRHIELVAAVVLQMQELGVALAEVHVEETEVAADAVRDVHHRVADLELGKVAQPAFHGGGLARVAAHAAARGGGIELGLGQHREPCSR